MHQPSTFLPPSKSPRKPLSNSNIDATDKVLAPQQNACHTEAKKVQAVDKISKNHSGKVKRSSNSQKGASKSQEKQSNKRSSRRRGVLLTEIGRKKLRDFGVLHDQHGDHRTYEMLGAIALLSPRTVAKILGRESGVDLRSMTLFFEAFEVPLSKEDYILSREARKRDRRMVCDIDEAIRVEHFCGREAEINQLQQWVSEESVRLVSISGIAGIGKTALVAHLIAKINSAKRTKLPNKFNGSTKTQTAQGFDLIVWKSLSDAPSLQSTLSDIISFASQTSTLQLDTDKATVKNLLCLLRQRRCLLVFDGWENLFAGGDRSGIYRQGYEDYRHLLTQIAKTQHQSCVLITSREIPTDIACVDETCPEVKTMNLMGLSVEASKQFLSSHASQRKPSLLAAQADWHTLVDGCCGNPLALSTTLRLIETYMHGDIRGFMRYVKREPFISDRLREQIERQMHRLTRKERSLLRWLAIAEEDMSLNQVCTEFSKTIAPQDLLLTIDSLRRRSLLILNKSSDPVRFSVSPLIRIYLATQHSATLKLSDCQSLEKTLRIEPLSATAS